MKKNLSVFKGLKKKSFILLLIPVFIMYLSSFAFAATVTPTLINDNKDPVLEGYTAFKPQGENFSNGELTVTIEFTTDKGEKLAVSWSANILVDFVFVKGGPVGNLYAYDLGVTSDTGLTAPVNPNNGKVYSISHVTFYYRTNDGGGDDDELPPGGGGGDDDELPPGGGGGDDDELPPGGGGGDDDELPPGGGGGDDDELPPGDGDGDDDELPPGGNDSFIPDTPIVIIVTDSIVPQAVVEEEEIEEEEIPLAIFEVEEEVLLDEEVPLAVATLPQTGEVSPLMFYGLGALVSALGLKVRKRK